MADKPSNVINRFGISGRQQGDRFASSRVNILSCVCVCVGGCVCVCVCVCVCWGGGIVHSLALKRRMGGGGVVHSFAFQTTKFQDLEFTQLRITLSTVTRTGVLLWLLFACFVLFLFRITQL